MKEEQKNKPLTWNNAINQHNFYEHQDIEMILRDYAELGGLASGCDVDKIFNLIKQAQNLLDVGSGYGRVIGKLINLNFQGKIHALEKSSPFQKSLTHHFQKKIHLHPCSILDFQIDIKFDAILSLWSGISDFTPTEQIDFFKKLSSLLTEEGRIIIDTSVWDQKPLNATNLQSQHYLIQEKDCTLHGYIPTYHEIANYAQDAGLKIIKWGEYYTDTDRRRLLYVLALNSSETTSNPTMLTF